jgi:hypothetical protein
MLTLAVASPCKNSACLVAGAMRKPIDDDGCSIAPLNADTSARYHDRMPDAECIEETFHLGDFTQASRWVDRGLASFPPG